MNEALVKKLIKCKLEAANAIVESLPEPLSGELKSFQQVVFESLKEFEQEQGKTGPGKNRGTLNSISIE